MTETWPELGVPPIRGLAPWDGWPQPARGGRIVHPASACADCLASGAPLYHYTEVIEYGTAEAPGCQVSIAHGCAHVAGVVPVEAALARPGVACWTPPVLDAWPEQPADPDALPPF
jgi:hypothetical protein